ncbi:NnrU family protein, required for expression of nitric oxide and nitrite reductase (Nir and Nor) [Candidatus Burkholderia verschuerenii]|uniref:NnrU family protein, required for expression of nitric oxide and nitrite reductase (Nir and Nor) n=1 Tax=Candidatus Burkholderia verschuerenii TaxID=242163 RepID=A0A0L0MHV1_9BURK|nr:NnrU family protein [Candidatus Burkholderia verschuerenii]KND61539.1 NnrU family protein, required for expression of nitric oxide and nitrite reductase (Nir and Nor) [Candidatus Burkholderia verschuerenii]
MFIFVAGLVVFLGMHSISIVAPAWRDAQVNRLGEGPWKGLYSVISIASFIAMIYGYGMARAQPVALYMPPMGLKHLTFLLMLPVFPFLIAAYFPGRVRRLVRHPMLWALILWSASHLLCNGTLNDVLVFGGFLLWAVADLISVSSRTKVRAVRGAPASAANDAIVIVVGLALYALMLFWAHAHLIGVSPLA